MKKKKKIKKKLKLKKYIWPCFILTYKTFKQETLGRIIIVYKSS